MNVGEGETRCFLLVPTSHALRVLRRWSLDEPKCTVPGIGYHDTLTIAREVRIERSPDGTVAAVSSRRKATDPPWPTTCGCGYTFRLSDHRQITNYPLYARADDPSVRYTLRWGRHDVPGPDIAPPGAMWDATWNPAGWRGSDGHSYVVRCPNRMDWTIDAPSSGGGRWSRTGVAPDLTVSPSIAIGRPEDPDYYHGFLQGGVLTAHIG